MQTDFEFSINGDIHRGGGKPVEYSLLDYLLENSMITGKDSPNGGIGVCSVLLVGRDSRQKPILRLARACEMTLPMVAGREIWTAEGLEEGEQTHSLQEALAMAGQFSCKCSSHRHSMDSGTIHGNNIKKGFGASLLPEEGSFFRTTGYMPLPSGLKSLLHEKQGSESVPNAGNGTRLLADGGLVTEFAYRDPCGALFYRPVNLKAALRLLQAHPGAKIVAADTIFPGSTHGELPCRDSRQVVVSLESVIQLREVGFEQGQWQIGGAVTISSLAEALGGRIPLIEHMVRRFSSLQARNRSTVGAHLCLAARDSELASVLLALDAEVLISGLSGERKFMLRDFLEGAGSTAVRRGEILRSVLLECRALSASEQESNHHLSGFYKVARRNLNGRAIVCGAFAVEINDEGRVTRSRLCYGGVAAHAMRAHEAEELLTGELWGTKLAHNVEVVLRESFPTQTDYLASADYRKAMVIELWRKFFAENRKPGTCVPVHGGLDGYACLLESTRGSC
ncbi:MAG: hypothetical protein GY899_15185 [Verrucomicrobiaceae bacterium]|nr:hypothetical protein [Verrucomicrobiaceae bacterium]